MIVQDETGIRYPCPLISAPDGYRCGKCGAGMIEWYAVCGRCDAVVVHSRFINPRPPPLSEAEFEAIVRTSFRASIAATQPDEPKTWLDLPEEPHAKPEYIGGDDTGEVALEQFTYLLAHECSESRCQDCFARTQIIELLLRRFETREYPKAKGAGE